MPSSSVITYSPPWYQASAASPDWYAAPAAALSSSGRLRSAVSAATSSPSSGSVRLPLRDLDSSRPRRRPRRRVRRSPRRALPWEARPARPRRPGDQAALTPTAHLAGQGAFRLPRFRLSGSRPLTWRLAPIEEGGRELGMGGSKIMMCS